MLGGLAPLIVFTFYNELEEENIIKGTLPLFGEYEIKRIPFMVAPIYLDERVTQVILDDHSRQVQIDVLQDGTKSYERVNSTDVTMTFRAQRDNVVVTAVLALFEHALKFIESQSYTVTVFYDDVFILDGAIKSFNTQIIDNTDTREIIVSISNRPDKVAVKDMTIKNIGTGFRPEGK